MKMCCDGDVVHEAKEFASRSGDHRVYGSYASKNVTSHLRDLGEKEDDRRTGCSPAERTNRSKSARATDDG